MVSGRYTQIGVLDNAHIIGQQFKVIKFDFRKLVWKKVKSILYSGIGIVVLQSLGKDSIILFTYVFQVIFLPKSYAFLRILLHSSGFSIRYKREFLKPSVSPKSTSIPRLSESISWAYQ